MSMADITQKVTIAGGGLAGLACGIRLLELGRKVELHERRKYPLKKVCGEFLSPLGWQRCLDLGVAPFLKLQPVPLKNARFYFSGRGYFDFALSPHAWGISRAALDTALAERFRSLGGDLKEGSSLEHGDFDATGRSQVGVKARWMGWKGYLEPSLAPEALRTADLLMLPITRGYCGLSPIEDGRISVCLVAKAPASPDALLRSHPLLAAVADSVRPFASIAGFDFISTPGPSRLGDAARVWPPLVGDGMSRALHSGMLAAEGARKSAFRQGLQFRLSKALHSSMLFHLPRKLLGPGLRALPSLAAFFYRHSRG